MFVRTNKDMQWLYQNSLNYVNWINMIVLTSRNFKVKEVFLKMNKSDIYHEFFVHHTRNFRIFSFSYAE